MGFARAKVAMMDMVAVARCSCRLLLRFTAAQRVLQALLLGLSAVSAKAKRARSTQQWMRPKR